MGKKVDRDQLYEKLRNLEKASKKKPKSLKSKDGVFLLDPNDKHQKNWYEKDQDFGGYDDEDE